MNKVFKILFVMMAPVVLVAGCAGDQKLGPEQYIKWVGDTENGLIKTRKVNGIEVSVKYLPNEYLIYKELKNIEEEQKQAVNDSLYKAYEGTMTFLFTIGPDEEKGNKDDIMLTGLRNYHEYVDRSMTMNFELENFVSLKTGEKEIKPVLSSMENVYGLGKSRNILFVFAPEQNNEDFEKMTDLDFIYADELFELGILHFNFRKEDFKNIPALNY